MRRDPGRVRRIVAAAGLVAVLSAVAAVLWLADGRRGSTRRGGGPEARRLARALVASGFFRPVEARLSFDSRYAACSPAAVEGSALALACSPPPSAGSPEYGILTRALRARPRPFDLQRARHLRGAGSLLDRRSDPRLERAVAMLAEAATESPEDSGVLTDLSAARLERARLTGDAVDLLEAVSAAVRATRLDPEAARPRFNLALALTRLPLTARAAAAWAAYLALDPGSGWAVEARGHLAALEGARAGGEAIEALLPRSDEGCRELAGRAQELFEAGNRHLEGLARAIVEGDSGPAVDENRRQARELARCLRAVSPDPLLPAELEVLAAAEGGDPLLARGRGHLHLARARRGFAATDLATAERELAAARPLLVAAGSDSAHWCSFWAASVLVYRNRYPAAVAALDELEAEISGLTAPTLRGRLRWVRGLARVRQARTLEALVDYRAALADLEAAGLTGYQGSLHILLAESLGLLGQEAEAWEHRRRAFDLVPAAATPHQAHSLLWDSALASLELGLPGAAEELLLEALDQEVARPPEQRSPLRPPVYWMELARVHRELGDLEVATADLERAREGIAAIADEELRLRTTGLVDQAEAELLVDTDPGAALAVLDPAIEAWRQRELDLELPALLARRAEAYRALGDPGRALADLEEAVARLTVARERVTEGRLARSFAASVREVFGAMARQRALASGDPEGALEVLERSRAFASAEGAVAAVAEVVRALPEDTALLQYALVEGDLLGWCSRRGDTRFLHAELTPAEVSRLLGGRPGWRTARSGTLRRLGELRELLLGGFEDCLAGARELVFVADPHVTQLPLAALWDRGRQRFLVEDHAVAVVPALHFGRARQGGGRRTVAPSAGGSVLVVGVAGSPVARGMGLAELSAVEVEVQAIGALYPEASHELLLAGAATPAAVRRRLGVTAVLHFAGHAVAARSRIDGAFLLLAPGKGAQESGVVTAEDLGRWPIGGLRLAFLSACETAAARHHGSDGLGPLVQPLLGAGVEAVIGTLWRVDDRAMAALAPEVHRALLAGHSVPEALRQAQLTYLTDATNSGTGTLDWAALQAYGSVPQR